MNYCPSHGNPNARILILGECPLYEEARAFDKNYELDKVLQSVGIQKSDCWLTNVCKYYVQPNPRAAARKIPFHVRLKNQLGLEIDPIYEEIRKEIFTIAPNVIVALGNTALYALSGQWGIQDYRGSILSHGRFKFIPTYNPIGLTKLEYAEFIGYWNKAVIIHDFRRVLKHSFTNTYDKPSRHLGIATNSAQLLAFKNRHEGKTKPAVDIEARGKCIPACIGIAYTPHEGITVPLWNVEEYQSVLSCSNQEMAQMWTILAEMLDVPVIGQNFKYDEDKINRLGFRVRGLASDTMLKAFAINPELPKGLAFNTSIYTEEPFYKNEGMYEGSLHDLFVGCSRDACVTKEIDIAMDPDLDEIGMRDYYENFILKLHPFYLGIELEGFNINPATRDGLFKKYIKWSEALNYELYQIVGDYVNINSPKQVSRLLYDVFNIPRKSGVGEEVITEILNLQGLKLSDEYRRALEIILEKRRVDKTIGTYLAALPDFDGKMRTTYYPCLETGRSSSSQLEPPIRPLIDIVDANGKKKFKPIGTAFQTLTKHGDIGQDVRSQYEPDKGYVLVNIDSAQAEARVVFLLADDEEALHDIDAHDYHALTASWFFGGTEADYSKRTLGYESPNRFIGKTLRHACHLGASARRATTTVNTDARKFKINIKITQAFAQNAINIFHTKQPKIRANFQQGVVKALTDNRRYLTAGIPYGVNSKIGGKRQFLERFEEELFRQAYSYIPQRSVSDNTKNAGMRLQKREPRLARILLEAHDSLLFMIPEKEVNYFVPMAIEEMERPIRFDTCSLPRRDLIIPAEVEVGYNYQEFKKWQSSSPSSNPLSSISK